MFLSSLFPLPQQPPTQQSFDLILETHTNPPRKSIPGWFSLSFRFCLMLGAGNSAIYFLARSADEIISAELVVLAPDDVEHVRNFLQLITFSL